MKDDEILQALTDAAKLAVAQSLNPELPIAFVDVAFTPPNDQKYLELLFIPVNDDDEFWGTEQNYRGMWRMILHWPNQSTGPKEPMQLLRSIVSYFSKDRFIPGVSITTNPNFMGALVDGHEILYPAGVRYQRFVAA